MRQPSPVRRGLAISRNEAATQHSASVGADVRPEGGAGETTQLWTGGQQRGEHMAPRIR